jgi:hypothetical protein
MDSQGTVETPIVIDEDGSESPVPLERKIFAVGKESAANYGTVKAEAILALKQTEAIELATGVSIPASLKSPMEMHLVPSTCIETDTDGAELEYGTVKAERAVGATEGTVFSQDEDIVVGGTSVEV